MEYFMFQAMILGFFGLYDVTSYLYHFSTWAGVILLCIALKFPDPLSYRAAKYLKTGVIILLLRLIPGHVLNMRWIEYYDHFYYVIPEIMFLSLSAYVMMQKSGQSARQPKMI